MEATHYRACTLCEAICGLEIKVRDGAITSIRGDAEDPFSKGHICPKAVALKDIQEDQDRLRRPLRRTATGWEEIAWEEALDEAAAGLRKIQDASGNDTVAAYVGNPNVHNYGNILFLPSLLRSLGSKNTYSATSADQLPHHLTSSLMFGHGFLLPIPDLDRTEFFLMLGANPAVSNGSMMTAPGMRRRLKEIRDRGGNVVGVDPRRTETSGLADQHLFIRPGTDALLLAALLHTLFAENRVAPGPLAELADGLDEIEKAVTPFSPEAVAATTGIGAEEIRHLARRFAEAPRAVAYGRMGVSTQRFGTLCQGLINLLNFVTGNLDAEGGAMFPLPAVSMVRSRPGRQRFDRWKSRVRGLPEYAGELPVATLADEILTPGEGQIRGLLTVAGNPVLSTPNGSRLDEALASLDFMVSVDFYLNETTRHAHLILPPTPPLEHDHYDLAFNALAVRNVTRFSEPVIEAPEDSRHDWQILHALRCRLERDTSAETLQRLQWEGSAGPAGLLGFGVEGGPYGEKNGGSLSLEEIREAAHGLDLGPLKPCLAERIHTGDGRIHLAPTELLAEATRLKETLDDETSSGSDTLLLIGRRHVRSNNSWMHNYPRLMRGKTRCTLLMNPADAERYGFEEGDPAEVTSRVGSVTASVEITDTIMTGVVSLPHGWGHGRKGTKTTVAADHPGVSINDLTDEQEIDALSGNAAFNGVAVTVNRT